MYQKPKASQFTAAVHLRFALFILLFLVATTLIVLVVPSSQGANPTSGSISESSPLVTWSGPFKTPTGSANCSNDSNGACDNFQLTIQPPSSSFGPYLVEIKLKPELEGDWDMQVYGPGHNLVDGSGNSPGQTELVVLMNPPGGTYTVSAAPFAPVVGASGNSYSASAELKHHIINPANQGQDTNISYHNFAATGSLGNSAGEPSIGVNWNTGRAMFIALRQTLRATFDDSTIPAKVTWEDKSFTWTNLITMDPILFTDRKTGRTIVSQLASPAGVEGTLVLTDGCSLSAYTDNDGDSWIVDQGCGLPSGADHQSIGGGPFHAPLPGELPLPNPLTGYSHATYYCAQSALTAYCSRSDDGGVTYGPGVPIYTAECGGLHGHPMVGSDGTVYVPNKNCGGKQGVAVSEDNGITWSIRTVPNTLGSANDPGVGIGAEGTVYLGYQNGDGRPSIAVSRDKGLNWTPSVDVGGAYGIKNTAFPRVVAGDDDRAAFAFLGTPTEGPFQDASFAGEWHLYIAHTFDRGQTWTTIDATPTDPVQRGCIWLQGGSNPCRNLLDFMGSAVDKQGRVLIGYADGCINCASPSTSRASKATIARQVNGRRLFKEYDPTGEPTPTPTPTATPTPTPTPGPSNVLHFHGNPNDDPGYTGTGHVDLELTDGPFLDPRAALGTGPAAHWDIANPATLNGTNDQNIYDPNWIWTLSAPTTLVGDMNIRWWASCGACGAGNPADWTIRLFADNVNVFETRLVNVTPDLPNVPKLLQATVTIPQVTASNKFVLQIDPAYVDTQVNTHIYYDSQSPCPGVTGGAPCDSQVTMPIYDPNATPTPTPIPSPTPVVAYLKGGISFSPNYTVRAPYIGQDAEPSLRSDKFGNTYVAAIRGVPGGTDLWYFDLRPTINGMANPNYDPYMRHPLYRGQPDSFLGSPDISLGADGGGDVDMAVGLPSDANENLNALPTLAYSSLTAANISAQQSKDRGVTFTKNPVGNVTGGIPADDRQWMEFFGQNTVYLLYRTLAPAVTQIQQSTDGGLTYGPAATAGAIGQVGGIDVDQNDGTVYISGSSGSVAVGIPPAPGLAPLTYTVYSVAPGNNAHLFFTVKVGSDGTVYVCYSDDHQVYIQYSRNKGETWSVPIRVSDGPDTRMSIFPWMETGSTPGTVGVVWYGTDQETNTDADNWKVFYALGMNVTTNNPTFQQVVASDHVIHAANISENGLAIGGQSPNRNLLDYFQIAFDPTGAAVIAFADDHNDISGQTYVMRQTGGPAANGNSVPSPVEGSALPAPTPLSSDGSQVVDDRRDVRYGGNPELGGIVVLPTDDPLDILSVKYSTEPDANGAPILVTRLTVSDMATLPPSSNWRISFVANAPDSVMSPTGGFTFGLSDRGDQFFVRASTDASGAQTFVYGTAKREFSGGITYTGKGTADSGAFDTVSKTLTIKVALSKLNALLPADHQAIGAGSILVGLRAQTYTTIPLPVTVNGIGNSGNNKQDTTRGGTLYAIDSPPTAVLTAQPLSGTAPLSVNFDASTSSDPDPGDTLSYTFDFGDGTSPVTQTSPSASHVYNRLGIYTATLKIKDSSQFESNSASVQITVNEAPQVTCLEDDDAKIAYSNGWHLVQNGNASGGHFRFHSGNSSKDFASLSFTVSAGRTGAITYYYAKSPKGGTAEVFLDGVSKGLLNYKGNNGTNKSPEFRNGGVAYQLRFDQLGPGDHKFELRNMKDSVYLDSICLESSTPPSIQPPNGPGSTSSSSASVNPGQESNSNLTLGPDATEISVVAEATNGAPIKLVLVDPAGITLQIVNATNGVAVLSAPVSKGGLYTVKVVNLSLGPIEIWSVATPYVRR